MKHRLLLSNIRKIKSSSKRFISLLLLAMLGVGFFVGIKATSPDMLKTLDSYLDEQEVYDIEITSTLGLTNEDKESIENLNIADKIVPVKSLDEIVTIKTQEKIIKIISLSSMNKVTLKEGILPESQNQVVVEQAFLKENGLHIGDTFKIPNEKLKTQDVKIVGIIESPLYFSSYRGTTTLGNGELNYYVYANEDLFSQDYYNDIYIILKDSKEKITNSKSYQNLLEKSIKTLESIKEERETAREESLYQFIEENMLLRENFTFQKATWYILDRTDNQAYKTYIDSTESLTKLGSVFPLIFYIVAILICLISMTRMIMEDRTEIGTLKGLGFSNILIVSKYILYSSLATIIGGCLGMIIGFNLLPRVIWKIYQSLFTIPIFICDFNLYYAILGLFIAILCICGATILTTYKTLKEKPSNLMRPTSPKIGKKILLEKISFLWNKLKFSDKITIRNIFRYKKRILITILGIAGSTSLILVGFGLKDSVNNVVEFNYNNIFVYNEMIYLKNNADISSLNILIEKNPDIEAYVEANIKITNIYNSKNENLEVNLIVPKNEDSLSKVIKLKDINKKEMISLPDNAIVLSEKLAKTLNVKTNDKVYFLINNIYQEINVASIVENYINDYAYMTKNTYEKLFESYKSNVIFQKNKENYDKNFDKEIIKIDNVSNIITTEATTNLLKNVLSSLNSVVIILIFAASCLAFVIFYNISTINISERKREISTLKVLGFYDEEVDAYIIKENYFITFIGIGIGLFIGLYLSHYIISTCEPQYIMFIRHVKISSYIISAIISFIFTIIVNKLTHYNLKKIDMVESLKNNE